MGRKASVYSCVRKRRYRNNLKKANQKRMERSVLKKEENLVMMNKDSFSSLLDANDIEEGDASSSDDAMTIDEGDVQNVKILDESIKRKHDDKPQPVHSGVQCTFCAAEIVGHRYKCVQCDDVNLCTECEADGAHPDHCVMRIPNSTTYFLIHNHFESIKTAFNKSLEVRMKKKSLQPRLVPPASRQVPPASRPGLPLPCPVPPASRPGPPASQLTVEIKPDPEQDEPKIEIPIFVNQIADPLHIQIKQEVDDELLVTPSTSQEDPYQSNLFNPTKPSAPNIGTMKRIKEEKSFPTNSDVQSHPMTTDEQRKSDLDHKKKGVGKRFKRMVHPQDSDSLG